MSQVTVECCALCEQPKVRTGQAGSEVELGWPACGNPGCPNYGQGVASAVYRTITIEDGEQRPDDT